MKKALVFTFAAAALLIGGLCVSVPVVNDLYAAGVADGLAAVPLPEGARLVEKTSAAGRFFGNGNGMQYFGALLLESERSPEEIGEYYSNRVPYCRAAQQHGSEITVMEHGNARFKTSVGDGNVIVYALGSARGFPMELFAELDLRGR